MLQIAYEGKLKALAKGGLTEAQRKAEERELTRAYEVLSDPLKRDRYDQQLDARAAKESNSARTGMIVGGVVLALVVAGVGWHLAGKSRERDRLRIEADKARQEVDNLVRDRERRERTADLEKARTEKAAVAEPGEVERLREEVARKEAELKREREGRAATEQETEAQIAERQRYWKDLEAKQEKLAQQKREQMEDEANQRRAAAEVEKIKQTLRENEAEEARIRAERQERVRADDAERQRERDRIAREERLRDEERRRENERWRHRR